MGSKLSIITDEISQDFEEVLQIAQGFGIKDVEVRGVWGKNIALFEDEDLKITYDGEPNTLESLLSDFNIKKLQ